MMCLIPSKKALDRVGDALLRLGENPEADDLVFQQLNSYRSLFNRLMYPVSIACRRQITTRLDKDAVKNAIVVQRIKRLDSIITKLQRQEKERAEKMQLSRMQDIGGVRVILSDIKDVGVYTEGLFARSKKIKIKKKTDYIQHPKEDGYRGIHYILELENKAIDVVPFKTLLVELQVRTKLQHCWATGVEIVGIINNKNYKTGDWDSEWKEFFMLLGDYFAKFETVVRPTFELSTIVQLKEVSQLVNLAVKLNIVENLNAFSQVFKFLEKDIKHFNNDDFLLLKTDFQLLTTEVTPYKNEALALEHLTVWEKRFRTFSSGKLQGQAVLVGAKDIKNLKKAYPNYYMDTSFLISVLHELEKQNTKK